MHYLLYLYYDFITKRIRPHVEFFPVCSEEKYVTFPLQDGSRMVFPPEHPQILFNFAFPRPQCLIGFLAADTKHF
jgi:hypothetical protein